MDLGSSCNSGSLGYGSAGCCAPKKPRLGHSHFFQPTLANPHCPDPPTCCKLLHRALPLPNIFESNLGRGRVQNNLAFLFRSKRHLFLSSPTLQLAWPQEGMVLTWTSRSSSSPEGRMVAFPPPPRTGAPSRLQDTRGSGMPWAAQGSNTSSPSKTASSAGPATMTGGTGWGKENKDLLTP